MGTDGGQLLWALDGPATPAWRRELPAIQTLRQVGLPQCYATPEGQPGRWRSAADLPPAPLLLSAPDDPAACYGQKRETEWTGDTVHGTDTGDDETPNRCMRVAAWLAPRPRARTRPAAFAALAAAAA